MASLKDEELIEQVKEIVQVLNRCPKGTPYAQEQWERVKQLKELVSRELSIEPFENIFTFHDVGIRDKNENEMLLDDVIGEGFSVSDEGDNKVNLMFIRRIFQEVRICHEEEFREVAYEILLWVAASSHDDVLRDLKILDDIITDIENFDFSFVKKRVKDSENDPKSEEEIIKVEKVNSYFEIIFLIILAPERIEDIQHIMVSKSITKFLRNVIEVLSSNPDNSDELKTFFIQYMHIKYGEIEETDKIAESKKLTELLPKAVQNWVSLFAEFQRDEELATLEKEFLMKLIGIFKEFYDEEQHGDIVDILNDGVMTMDKLTESIFQDEDSSGSVLEVMYTMLYYLQQFVNFKSSFEENEKVFCSAKECFNKVDMYFEGNFFLDTEEYEDLDVCEQHSDHEQQEAEVEVESVYPENLIPDGEVFALGKTAPARRTVSAPKRGSVMISYNWGQKPQARKLRRLLEMNGFDVWIDEEKMGIDLVESMAEAVESSDVIVMCASEEYQRSKNCKSEAKYAYENDKAIVPVMMEDFTREKWLKFIMGTKLYIPFFAEELTSDQMKQFINIVNKKMISVKGQSDVEKVVATLVERGHAVPIRSLGGNLKEDSSLQDLKRWFAENKIEKVMANFGHDLEADMVLQLKSIKKCSPRDYFKTIRVDYGICGSNLLRFDKAIDKL